MTTRISFLLCFFLATVLTACGGGGDSSPAGLLYSGVTSQASINAGNAQAIAIAAQEGVDAQVSAENVPLAVAITAENPTIQTVLRHTTELLQNNSSSNVPVAVARDGECGGYLDINASNNSGSIFYSNYCISDGAGNIIINGTMRFSYLDPVFNYEMINLSIRFAGETMTINASMTWNTNTNAITLNVRYIGSDGQVYQIANFIVSGNSSSLDVSGRVYHPSYGYVDIVTSSPLVYDSTCATGRPVSGVIDISGASGTATITFIDCNSYSVAVDGNVADLYTW